MARRHCRMTIRLQRSMHLALAFEDVGADGRPFSRCTSFYHARPLSSGSVYLYELQFKPVTKSTVSPYTRWEGEPVSTAAFVQARVLGVRV